MVELVIPRNAQPVPVPQSFLGFSTEYWTLPFDGRHVTLYGRVISLLRVPGDSPFVLRVGGDSSDYTFYGARGSRFPRWAFDITPEFVARVAGVVRSMHLRVILDLNLITASPAVLRAGVTKAQEALPPGSIIGYEIGNEPDLYNRQYWLQATQRNVRLPRAITPRSYATAYNAYAHALAQIAPGTPLLAPALANSNLSPRWVTTLLGGPHPGLRVITGHSYPYSACIRPDSEFYPTIDRVLSEQASTGMAHSVTPLVTLAHRAGLTTRLTEINSVTCGGRPGVSNTFATALWAPDALFELVRAGVPAVNLHAREFTVNDPFTFDARGLQARPLLYGLILFVRTLGPGAHLVPAHLIATAAPRLKAWVVRTASGELHVLLINKGKQQVRISLALPATATAHLQRMLAPSVASSHSITLAGQSLDEQGTWTGPSTTMALRRRAHRYLVTMAPYSAALLFVPTLTGPR
jgi:hypothetical protein